MTAKHLEVVQDALRSLAQSIADNATSSYVVHGPEGKYVVTWCTADWSARFSSASDGFVIHINAYHRTRPEAKLCD
jgi:hypothetical protein